MPYTRLDGCKVLHYIANVIRSFRSKGLRRFAATGDASKLAVQTPDRIRRILLLLEAAARPEQMDIAGFRFHALKGRDRGRYSVWASENYRITFGWTGRMQWM